MNRKLRVKTLINRFAQDFASRFIKDDEDREYYTDNGFNMNCEIEDELQAFFIKLESCSDHTQFVNKAFSFYGSRYNETEETRKSAFQLEVINRIDDEIQKIINKEETKCTS